MKSFHVFEGIHDFPVVDAVEIFFSFAGEAGMELFRDFFTSKNAYLFGKIVVQGAAKFVEILEFYGSLEIGDLSKGVDSGIGAAGAIEVISFAPKCRNGFFNQGLNRVVLGLDLPARKAGAIVGNSELMVDEAGHGKSEAGSRKKSTSGKTKLRSN